MQGENEIIQTINLLEPVEITEHTISKSRQELISKLQVMLGYAQSTLEDHIPNTLKCLDKALSYMKNPNKKHVKKENLNPLKKIIQQRVQYSEKKIIKMNVKCSQKKSIKKRDIPLLPKPSENEIVMCRDILCSHRSRSHIFSK
jgi:hypothetical protein